MMAYLAMMVTFADLSRLVYVSYLLPTTGKIQNHLHPIHAPDQVSDCFSPLSAWDEARRLRHTNRCQEVAVHESPHSRKLVPRLDGYGQDPGSTSSPLRRQY